MLEIVIQDLIRKQRPYFLLQGSPIKGVDNQHWLIFKHRDADNLLHNIVSFFGIVEKHATYKLLRIDPRSAQVFSYTPRQEGDVPSITLLRSSNLSIIETFLQLDNAVKEEALLSGSFLEIQIKGSDRRFNLPKKLEQYNTFLKTILERTKLYRRSTAYFDSGVLKLYEEPLQHIIQTQGEIRLLMDWQGFTKQRDVKELQKLYDPEYRVQYLRRTLHEFLQGLEDSSFSSTEILAELVRLGFLKIKLVKMEKERAIYHKKTGILSDHLDNHILHEGSDNFTRAAHSKNAESVTFFFSSEPLDLETIDESIKEFDEEWHSDELTFDLTQEFLQQILEERERRIKQWQPTIESISPDELVAGVITQVQIMGRNLHPGRSY
jgi:hypothetical protein